MALVVLLRGVNVGGSRIFRPAVLTKQLQHFGAINIGAAGTFVIPRRVARATLHDEIAGRLPFTAEIVIVEGREILELLSHPAFAGRPAPPGIVRFASALIKRPREAPKFPLALPATGQWLVQLVAQDGRFVLGQYRRHMKTIQHLGTIDRVLGAPVTTRNWNTITAIAKALGTG